MQKEAAKEAAREGQDVSIDTDTGAGAGRPVGNQGSNTGYNTNQGSNVSGANMSAGAGEYGPGEVIDRKYYTGVEARPQDQALGMTPAPAELFPCCLVLRKQVANVSLHHGVAGSPPAYYLDA